MSDTPRTDAFTENFYSAGGLRSAPVVFADFARELERELVAAKADSKTANARLALSMEAHKITISGTVASLLHMITLTREAAGCKDGENLIAVVRGLRAERDEARREICNVVGRGQGRRLYAADRGWKCFDAPHANATDVPVQDGGAA